MKVPKCASSTTSGVARRVASRLGLHGVTSTGWIGGREPGVWASHGALASQVGVARAAALDLPSFFFTLVREPLSRCLSEFYFFRAGRADAGGAGGDAARKVEALRGCRDFAHAYVRPTADASVNDTLGFYDLVGVAERFDESVVMLADLLGVDDDAVAYMPVKVADGQERHDGASLHTRRHTPWDKEDAAVRKFAASSEFQNANQMDYELHAAATARLDAFYAKPENRARLAHFKERREQLVAEVHDKATGAVDLDAAHRSNLIFGCETKRGEWGQ